MSLFDNFFKEVGIDLGTANTLIYQKHVGLVVNEPTVAAINNKTKEILAVGDEAKKMLGRTPGHISVIRPLVNGVISDYDTTHELLRQFLKRLNGGSAFSSIRRAVLAVPEGLTEVERKSVEDAAVTAGSAKVYLVSSPLTAALGAGLPIESPVASLIVDIGGGTTDIAVISLGGIVVSKTLKAAGDRLNDDIIKFMRDEFHLAIGESSAESAKISVGSAIPLDERLDASIRGRDFSSGLPKEIVVKNSQIRAAISKSLYSIIDGIREVVEMTPPELVGDMLQQGISLSGGGALLRGLDELVEKETGVSTRVVDEPLAAVIRGLQRIIDDFRGNRKFLESPLKPFEISL